MVIRVLFCTEIISVPPLHATTRISTFYEYPLLQIVITTVNYIKTTAIANRSALCTDITYPLGCICYVNYMVKKLYSPVLQPSIKICIM